MIGHLRNRYFFLSDIIFLPLAAYLSYVLRLDDPAIARFQESFAIFAVLVTVITPLVFLAMGIYARHWRYASIDELILLLVAVAVATILVTLVDITVLRFVQERIVLPRSIPIIFFLLALAVTAVPRLTLRLAGRRWRRENRDVRRRAVVMGAGAAGAMIVRELRNNPQVDLAVVGFLDDHRGKHGMRIHGLPVLGDRHQLPAVVEKYDVKLVIIAIPTAPGKTIRELVAVCEQAGVQAKIIPGMYELLDGSVSVNQLRDVEIEDLLRREPVQTDTAAVGQLLHGKRVLITGGGGSIGSELCRQVLACGPKELIVVGHGENSVFAIHNELLRVCAASAADTTIHPVIADIRFADRLHAVLRQHRPEVIFHAAAHKHVPLMETNPAEAITNNVLGTKNLLDAALEAGVGHFVMISTDKAVNPTSIMGATKRVAELLVEHAARRSGRAYVAVRFGNVLGSRGSVVPTFKQQIAAGGPVIVTHPEMVRYFMTIPEAVQLVLQAAVLGRGGEVFVLDMGEPIRIIDLAKDLIELSGLEVGRDIDIVFSGLRPGEKLYEELFAPGEGYRRTQHQKVFVGGGAGCLDPYQLENAVAKLRAAASRNDSGAILEGLQLIVPEFRTTMGSISRKPGSRIQDVVSQFDVTTASGQL